MTWRLIGSTLAALLVAALVSCGGDDGSADTTAPGLSSTSLTPAYASAGGIITAVFTSDEVLSADPVVSLMLDTPRAFSVESANGNEYVMSYTVAGDEPEGVVAVEATLVDASSNTAQGVGLGTVVLDFSAPTPSNIGFGASSHLRAGVTGVITFNAGEPLAAGGVVEFVNSGNLDGVELVPQQGTSLFTGFAYTPVGTEAEGQTQVTVTLADLAGNSSTSAPIDAFVLDFTAPALDVSTPPVVVTPTVSIAAADTLEVQFTASEAIAEAEVVARLQGGSDVVALIAVTDVDALAWTATRDLGPAAAFSAGTWDVEVTLVDLAGNETLAAIGAVVVNN